MKVSALYMEKFKNGVYMIKLFMILIVSSTIASASECENLYEQRGESLQTTLEAFECFEKANEGVSDQFEKSKNLNKMAYLKFFQGSFYENDSLNVLYKSFSLVQDSIKLFGPLFNRDAIEVLTQDQIEEVALSYYLYGTSVSKYVDLKGKWEAIKRMSEIKNTMKMILSLKQPSTFHFGAYRTLAIFNLKVPKIAGGSLARSKMFFEKLMEESKTSLGVISYPVGHIFYAEYLIKTGNKQSACAELNLVKSLTDEQIEANFKDLVYETKKDREVAKETFENYSC